MGREGFEQVAGPESRGQERAEKSHSWLRQVYYGFPEMVQRHPYLNRILRDSAIGSVAGTAFLGAVSGSLEGAAFGNTFGLVYGASAAILVESLVQWQQNRKQNQ